MTGYGYASASTTKSTITVEVRTVNNRYLDFVPKIPRAFLVLEDKIKKTISRYFQRGRIEVYIEVEGNIVHKTLKMDWSLLEQYMNYVKEIKTRYEVSREQLPMASIFSFPDLMTITEPDKESTDALDGMIVEVVKQACEQVIQMRKKEGEFLLEDIKKRSALIYKRLAVLEERREYVIQAYDQRIQQRIEEYIGASISVAQPNLLQEIAILAEKGDITEEITRLSSHLHHFWEVIEGEEEQIGRKLDFILQEMLRETNTIGAKSTDSQISISVVTIKSNLEKIKEQVQNIE